MLTKETSTLAKHTAGPAIAGYIYQLQWAVVRLLELREGEALGIEVLDDLHVAHQGTTVEQDQIKYHGVERTVRLTDTSPELWKTLGIWARAVVDGSLDLAAVQRLVLLTRATVPAHSLAEILTRDDQVDEESVDKIVARLQAISVPTSRRDRADYEAVHTLSPDALRLFVQRLMVCADQPSLSGITEALQRRLRRNGFHEQTLDMAVQRLYGWVWDILTARLDRQTSCSGILITEAEFQAAHCRIRDELVDNHLPVRFAEAMPSQSDLAGQSAKVYMQQLALVSAPRSLTQRSILAYFRANSERTAWTERGEVLPGELRRYDHELIERWQVEFETICDDCEGYSSDEELCRKGLDHLHTIERFEIPIRSGWLHRYLTYGSYHILADQMHVGWHPHFESLMRPGARETSNSETRDREKSA